MLSIEEKKKMVERGLEQFHINPEFRDCLKWFVDEMDKVYEKKIEQEWKEFWYNMDNPPKIKPKSLGKYKLVKIN